MEFIFQCHIFLSFHTVHGVLKARILKWFALETNRDHSVVLRLHPSSAFRTLLLTMMATPFLLNSIVLVQISASLALVAEA